MKRRTARPHGGNMQDLSQAALFSLIGNTPMVEVTRMDTGPCRLFLKLESQNPGGSIKDRVGRAMIEAAERDGRLQPGGTVVAAPARHTGRGRARVARVKGDPGGVVVAANMGGAKIRHRKA
ncbi:pyridoxal-phosphate dependent enzyme, partial [Massilia sp. CT11-108]|uniref:pyridoxal-phosphate dependent enzyme n=1 Tax=Massilia sp. CT11-108 TaxID=3393900 RepID=UPI0039A748D7